MPLSKRIGRLHPPVLCFIVSRAAIKDGDVEKAVTEAVAGGVTMVQLRENDAPAGEVLVLARSLKSITRGKAILIVNDRVDVCQAAEIDGVQLPEDGLPTRAARLLIGRYGVLGRNVHDAESGQAASQDGAEYVLAGPIYKSKSKSDTKPSGSSLISDITGDSSLPVLAVGGITAEKVPEVIEAGAAGIAVVSAIADADDPKAAAAELTAALNEAWTAKTAPVAGV